MRKIDSFYVRHPDIAWRLIQEDALLVDPRNGTIFPLNPVGARIWGLLDGNHCLSEVIEIITDEFDAPSDMIREDTDTFVSKLVLAGLIMEAPTIRR